MKTLKIFQILSLLIAAILCSCSKGESLGQEAEGEVYTVSLKLNGEITTSDSPLTRGTATDDLYGVLVLRLRTNINDYIVDAYGLYDNIEDIKIKLKSSDTYKFVVTAVKDGKNVLYSYNISKTHFSAPYEMEVTNTMKTGSNTALYGYFKKGTSKLIDGKKYDYPETDRFYGEIENYTPIENGTVDINLKRVAFGLKYQVSGLTDGTLSVTINNSSRTFFSESGISSDCTSQEKIFTFLDVYSAWQYADYYTERVTVSASWVRGIGITQDLGSKEVVIKRNKMNIVHIKLSTDETDNNLGIEVETDDSMDDEDVTVKLDK